MLNVMTTSFGIGCVSFYIKDANWGLSYRICVHLLIFPTLTILSLTSGRFEIIIVIIEGANSFLHWGIFLKYHSINKKMLTKVIKTHSQDAFNIKMCQSGCE